MTRRKKLLGKIVVTTICTVLIITFFATGISLENLEIASEIMAVNMRVPEHPWVALVAGIFSIVAAVWILMWELVGIYEIYGPHREES